MGVSKENLHLDLGAEGVNPVSGILDLINVALLTFFLQECTHFLSACIPIACGPISCSCVKAALVPYMPLYALRFRVRCFLYAGVSTILEALKMVDYFKEISEV